MPFVWTNFLICLFFGWAGVHKFLAHKKGWGVVYLLTFGLFLFGWGLDALCYLIVALQSSFGLPELPLINGFIDSHYGESNGPLVGSRRLNDDELLPVVPSHLVLRDGELCHYYGSVTHVKTKNVVVGYSGGGGGASFRVARGVSIGVGQRKTSVVRDDIQERTAGVLAITDYRVVFSAQKHSFDQSLTSLSSVTPLKDAVIFQFGQTEYPLLAKEPLYICDIIWRVINAS